MLDLRLYRVTLLPFVILLVAVAFSLHPQPAALPNAAAAQTFNGSHALAKMRKLAAEYPDRTPGSASDDALAALIASRPSPDGLANPFFRISVLRATVDTTVGSRTVETVIATRAGSGPPIVLIADRSNAPAGSAAGLSATATLLELASIYRDLVTTGHTLVLVSTSGGASAMGALADALPPGTEAAIVLGDLAGDAGRGPYVVPWSGGGGIAPGPLRRAVSAALSQTLPATAADATLSDQLARIALPLTTAPQGPLGAAGIPAVFVSADGEAQPPARERISSAARITGFGQALLSLTINLDGAPALASAPTRDVILGSQVLGGGGVRIVIGALLLSLAGCTLDVLARARRRRAPVGRWCGWVLSHAAPFLLAGLFAAFLGAGGLLPATPAAPVSTAVLGVSGAGVAALVSVGLLFVLAWVLRSAALARRRFSLADEGAGAGAALLITVTILSGVLWLDNPYTAALVIVPAHVWLVVVTREHRVRAGGAVAFIVSLAPVAAVVALLCARLAIEPFALGWTLILAIAGGALSPAGLFLLSVSAGCFIAAAVLLLAPAAPGGAQRVEVTVRGPLRYAGPGSLGGTESALHR